MTTPIDHAGAMIDAEPYPRFSDSEMTARRRALDDVMADHEVDHLILYGAKRTGTAVPWLTGWQVTHEAYVIVTAGERDVLLVQNYNHVPTAARMAVDAEVRWVGPDPVATAIAELAGRGGAGGRIGLIGGLGYREHQALGDFAEAVVPLDAAYTRLRLKKSEEEIAWTRRGCALTDAGMAALRDHARIGMSEAELADVIERAYVAEEGVSQVRYLAATAMTDPHRSVPSQWPERRRLRVGDVVMCELSAAFWGYPGQALRSFTVGAEPTPLYAELHAAASAAFAAALTMLAPGVSAGDLTEAGRVIDDAGFTIRDSFGHGFVPGILPPSIHTPGVRRGPVPDFVFEPGMMVVIQPNPVTVDESAGVQTGELLLVTEDGATRLHTAAPGFGRIED